MRSEAHKYYARGSYSGAKDQGDADNQRASARASDSDSVECCGCNGDGGRTSLMESASGADVLVEGTELYIGV